MYIIIFCRQNVFGDANSLANNKKTFAFLMKFLSDIMPFEAAVYLKVSIYGNEI